MVVKQSALDHNVSLMARYAAERGFLLAPHGKTTMAPQLFSRQLAAGAWGMTVANPAQAAVAYEAGAQRALVANEVIGAQAARAIVELLSPGGRRLICLVDSPAGAGLLDDNLERAGMTGRLDVLVEMGSPGARAGARHPAEALAVARAVGTSRHLRLVGVEGFEGAVAGDRSQAALEAVGLYLATLRRTAVHLAREGAFPAGEPVLVSAGGSKYFDLVATELGPGADYEGLTTELVARPGCYLVHDHGIYATSSPLARGTEVLMAALEVWAEVLSVPEPGLAIVGMGKRDVSHDLGLPVPLRLVRGQEVTEWSEGHVAKLDDQHGYLVFGATTTGGPHPEVGDLVSFGLSHPCTALDKWRSLLLVDDQWVVREEIATYFH